MFRFTSFVISGVIAGLTILAHPQSLAAEPIEGVNEYYLIDYDYNRELAYPGTRNLYLTVTTSTPLNLTVPQSKQITFAKYEGPKDSGIEIALVGHEGRKPVGKYAVETNTFSIKIPEGTEPQIYKIKFKFQYPDESTVDRFVDLNVGLRSKGKLRVLDTESDPLTAGSQGSYKLKLSNDYPDYPVNIHQITVSSVPSYIISKLEVPEANDSKVEVHGSTVVFKPPFTIQPFQQPSLLFNFKLSRMSLSNWISGFGDGSKLIFDVEYDDSNGRTIGDLSHETKVKLRPSDWTLLAAMLFGVSIGTGLKFYLEYLRGKGVIDKRGVAIFVTITVIVGVVVTIIAWAGQIQIIAFKDMSFSYDRPAVIFIMGLVGALGGIHFLITLAKKYIPASDLQQQ